jgi:formate dehydrogenase subunit gamma
VSDAAPTQSADAHAPDRITRHSGVARLGHWLMAGSTLVLLGTAFLPILGMEFAWVDIHWMAGVLLTVLVLLHVLRYVLFKPLRTMLIGPRDLRDGMHALKFNLRQTDVRPPLPGKYSPAQKAIHAVFAIVVLTAIGTGCLMLAKIDSPFWERDPYFLSDPTWGVIYVLHGFAALVLITLVMLHIYFSLRPEKRHYLRSMFTGALTRREMSEHHDPQRWQTGNRQ